MTKRIELQVYLSRYDFTPSWNRGLPYRLSLQVVIELYDAAAVAKALEAAFKNGPSKFTLTIEVPDERTCGDCVAWHKFSEHRNGWCAKSVSCREKRPDETCEKWEAANRGLAVKL